MLLLVMVLAVFGQVNDAPQTAASVIEKLTVRQRGVTFPSFLTYEYLYQMDHINLFEAAAAGNVELSGSFIAAPGVDINMKDEVGATNGLLCV